MDKASNSPEIQGDPLKASETGNSDNEIPSSLTEVVTGEQVMPAYNEPEMQDEQVVIPPTFPVISILDYETNEEFGEIYKYADSGELTGNARRDKPILIMAN